MNPSEPATKETFSPNQAYFEKSLDGVKKIVRLILNSWPCYQFAIKNQLGGSQTATKGEWFEEELSKYVYKLPNPEKYELSDWIEAIMCDEFDTKVEDGTLDLTAELVINMSNWLLGRGKSSSEEATRKLEENIEKLTKISSKNGNTPIVQKIEQSDDSESECSEIEEGEEDES